MKKVTIALSAALVSLGATQALAAGVNDFFRFEFYAAAPDRHIGTDTYRHHTDFQHYHDYYATDGYGDPKRHTSCREVRVRGEKDTASRITCKGRDGHLRFD